MAAQSISTEIARTRFEALRRNTWIGYALDSAGTKMFIDVDRSNSITAGDTIISTAVFGSSQQLQGVQAAANSSAVIVFDARGLPRTAAFEFPLLNISGETVRTIKVNGQGKVSSL
jgi:Type II transport protein GspH